MTTILQLQAAIKEARERLGDQHISTQVHAGLVDVVRAVPPESGRGRYTVTVLRADMTAAEAVAFLDAMQ